jgi:hypothetical protein
MAGVDLYGDITTPTEEDFGKKDDLFAVGKRADPSFKHQYGGESPGKEAGAISASECRLSTLARGLGCFRARASQESLPG